MRRWKRTNPTPIGIDAGGHSIKAVQLTASGSGHRVIAAATLPRAKPGAPLEREEIARLRDVLDRQGFAGRRVVLAAPRGKLITALQELPAKGAGAPLETIARVELARVSKCEPNSFEMGYWELPAAARASGTQVMAVACPHADADAVLDLFEPEGLAVEAIDVQHLALARAVTASASPADVCAAVDIGWTTTLLLLIHQGVVIYERNLREVRLELLHAGVRQKLDVPADAVEFVLANLAGDEAKDFDPELISEVRKAIAAHFEPMTHEIRAALSYAQHQYPQAENARVILAGGGASLAGLPGEVNQATGVEAGVFDPLSLAESGALRDRLGPSAAVAMGLALREADA